MVLTLGNRMQSQTETAMPHLATAAILLARLIFGLLFVMAFTFKFLGLSETAGFIASAGFPYPLFLAWVAALFEVALAFCLLTGAFFREAAIAAAIYVVFLAFSFHGPSHWSGGPLEIGAFIDHFTFLAGLLFAAVHGPGRVLALRYAFLRVA